MRHMILWFAIIPAMMHMVSVSQARNALDADVFEYWDIGATQQNASIFNQIYRKNCLNIDCINAPILNLPVTLVVPKVIIRNVNMSNFLEEIATTQYVINVSNIGELNTALSNATGGETIVLAAGDYGKLDLTNTEYTSNVTITSADPVDMATIGQISLWNVENLTIDQIELDFVPNENTYDFSRAVSIVQSSNITLSNSILEGGPAVNGVPPETDPGNLDATHNILGLPTGRAVVVIDSSDIRIEENEISQFASGIQFSNSDGLSIVGNEIHHLRRSPFAGSNTDDLLIDSNNFHTSTPWALGGAGDHADLIHLWTNPTQTEPTVNIQITNNVFNQGEGGSLVGFFLQDKTGNLETGYQNVTIVGNVIHNGDSQGMRLANVSDSYIANNTLLQSSGDENDAPGIVLTNSTRDTVIENNVLAHISISESVGEENAATLTVENNAFVQKFDADADNYVGKLFVDALAGTQATLGDLKALPGSIVDKMGAGSDLTNSADGSVEATGYVVDAAGSGLDLLTHQFQLGELTGPEGKIDTTGAEYTWNFDDGSTGTGENPSHTFTYAGEYRVTATVKLANGQTIDINKTIVVETSIALSMNFEDGAKDTSDNVNSVTVGENVTFEQGQDGNAIRLNGDIVSYQPSAEFYENTEYTVLLDFKKDAGDETASGRIINFSGSLVVSINGDGLDIAFTTDQGTRWLRPENLGLNNSDWHRVALTFSGEAGTATVYVDGKEVLRADGLEGAIQGGSLKSSFQIGSPWDSGFTGLIDNVGFIRGALEAGDEALNLQQLVEKITQNTDVNSDAGTDTDATGGAEANETDTTDSGDQTPTDQNNDNATPEPTAFNLIDGTVGSERLMGTDGADMIKGVRGQDFIYGGEGDDELFSGDENFGQLHGQGGDDVLHGGNAVDILFGGDGNDELFGGGGIDKQYGGNGNDVVSGGLGNDKLYGEAGDDTLFGNEDNDRLEGGDGRDQLFGGKGDDYLNGGNGDDILFAGQGRDRLVGGDGEDIFVFHTNNGRNTIDDFVQGDDLISINGLAGLTAQDLIDNSFDVHGDLLIKLDSEDEAFSWSNSNYIILSNVSKNDLDVNDFVIHHDSVATSDEHHLQYEDAMMMFG